MALGIKRPRSFQHLAGLKGNPFIVAVIEPERLPKCLSGSADIGSVD